MGCTRRLMARLRSEAKEIKRDARIGACVGLLTGGSVAFVAAAVMGHSDKQDFIGFINATAKAYGCTADIQYNEEGHIKDINIKCENPNNEVIVRRKIDNYFNNQNNKEDSTLALIWSTCLAGGAFAGAILNVIFGCRRRSAQAGLFSESLNNNSGAVATPSSNSDVTDRLVPTV